MKSSSCRTSVSGPEDFAKVIRHSSSQFASIENLEDLITCPIHLGLIDEPRQLGCGHVFCFDCLNNYSNSNAASGNTTSASGNTTNVIMCPLCREGTTLDRGGVWTLSTSYLHRQLSEYLLKKRQRVLEKSFSSDTTDLDSSESGASTDYTHIKLQFMRYLMKDLNGNHEITGKMQVVMDKVTVVRNGRFRSQSVNCAPTDESHSEYHSYNHRTVRKNMKRYRDYKVIKCFTNDDSSGMKHASIHVPLTESECLACLVHNDPRVHVTDVIKAERYHFTLAERNEIILPIFLKCQSGSIFVSGYKSSKSVSQIVQTTFQGQLVAASRDYDGNFGGFCFDEANFSLIVAYPSHHSLIVLDASLQQELRRVTFTDLTPMYVTKGHGSREVWITSPKDRKMAVYDQVSQGYQFFSTAQIRHMCVPSHAIVTGDGRLILLDSSNNHLYWIRKMQDSLHVQKLTIIDGPCDKMLSVESCSENGLLVLNRDHIVLAVPQLSPKELTEKANCVLL